MKDGIADAVVVDDGSDVVESGRIADVVMQYGMNECITFVQVAHGGAAAARNYGINLAKGDFIWCVDADDTILAESVQPLVDDLKAMSSDASLFHIGDMLAMHSAEETLPTPAIEPDKTMLCNPLQLVFPQGTIADHTTNIYRRSWLSEHPELRYPEDMQLLEDTVFALKVVEAATLCSTNSSYRFYVRHTYQPSSTSGAWAAERSSRFTVDICRFFRFLKDYADRHSDHPYVLRFYERYRYVYLRVMAVKGCAWSDIRQLMNIVGPVRSCQRPFYRLFTFICRTLRPKR